MSTINFYHGDCMNYMRDKPNGYYDLAIVDPPYGGGGYSFSNGENRFGGCFERYNSINKANQKNWGNVERQISKSDNRGGQNNIELWDYAPSEEYFKELFRISKHQIIWGGNYFNLPPCRCFLIWRKLTISEAFSMAMAEYAWTNFNNNAKVFECAPQGNKETRFHPTQKPITLYKWCLSLFAQKGWKLFDSHGGSMSSAIAAYQLGYDMDICELNDFYFTKGKERVEKHMKQLNLFE